KLTETGIQVITGDNFIRVISGKEIQNTDIKTLPYPGFPTDLQAQFMALMTTGTGSGMVKETVFENRFMYVAELNRMGADIKIDGRSAIVNGVKHLSGANVKATDLRAGAALIIAALTAEGQTEIGEIQHIDRGYVDIEKKLTDIGVDIQRIKEDGDGECTE
ncbi:MAG: UDP-N-acetylglucosamine 1-carboxyvinyltransferase, partial [Firmicutes bacterium]|nr:UDP-N-acetylglucosamine 1-carboxyvinyltransferase [Bacillota bacterium]